MIKGNVESAAVALRLSKAYKIFRLGRGVLLKQLINRTAGIATRVSRCESPEFLILKRVNTSGTESFKDLRSQ